MDIKYIESLIPNEFYDTHIHAPFLKAGPDDDISKWKKEEAEGRIPLEEEKGWAEAKPSVQVAIAYAQIAGIRSLMNEERLVLI